LEFHEKLQELRKSKGLTQEELAEALYVSRTAVSKWESGRGYPSIDSLKEISKYFAVSIDDLLSGETLLFLAEKENKSTIRNMCSLLFGILDICSFLLIILPLYPNTVGGQISSVNLFAFSGASQTNRFLYWILFLSLIVLGLANIALTRFKPDKTYRNITTTSMLLSILSVLCLALTRVPYATTMAFLLLVIKGVLLLKCIKQM
jgi:transcriptional regulator with XRE-family HTH domain